MITVVIGTFGSPDWRDLAWSRAHPSVPPTDEPGPATVYPATEIIVVHESTLARARNRGADRASNPWLCFLDADDELTPGYLSAMTSRIRAEGAVDRLFTPAVEYVGAGGRVETPMFHPVVPIEQGNWLVIGTVIPRALFLHVGGFEEWPKYEDWALFARMQKAGGVPVRVPEAIYRAHRNPSGRNHEGGRNASMAAGDQIRRAVFPELYQEAS